ncbi:hypothetical protein [Saccharopolyspora shandongensis]|uniref:hypothetical protein n=1 Tax=Saccharopolyspora shandongensis TaxID=418495 RepID=UPI00340E1465
MDVIASLDFEQPPDIDTHGAAQQVNREPHLQIDNAVFRVILCREPQRATGYLDQL